MTIALRYKENQPMTDLTRFRLTPTLLTALALPTIDLVCRKNADYSGAVFDLGAWSILVRLHDKLKRAQNLIEKDPRVINEPLADTVDDILGYALLWKVWESAQRMDLADAEKVCVPDYVKSWLESAKPTCVTQEEFHKRRHGKPAAVHASTLALTDPDNGPPTDREVELYRALTAVLETDVVACGLPCDTPAFQAAHQALRRYEQDPRTPAITKLTAELTDFKTRTATALRKEKEFWKAEGEVLCESAANILAQLEGEGY